MFVLCIAQQSGTERPATHTLRMSSYSPIIVLSKVYRHNLFVYKYLIWSCVVFFSGTNERDYSKVLDVPPMMYTECWVVTWKCS